VDPDPEHCNLTIFFRLPSMLNIFIGSTERKAKGITRDSKNIKMIHVLLSMSIKVFLSKVRASQRNVIISLICESEKKEKQKQFLAYLRADHPSRRQDGA